MKKNTILLTIKTISLQSYVHSHFIIMLSRRQVRIKVLQVLYAYQQSGNNDPRKGEKELLHSIEKFFDLFYYQISLFPEIIDVALSQIEEAKNKRIPTKEDLNPYMKFVNNILVEKLQENSHLKRIIERRKINWTNNQEIPKRIYRKFKASAAFNSCLDHSANTFEQDKGIILKLLKKFIYTHRPLFEYYEESSIHWVNDFDQVTFVLIKILQSLTEDMVTSYKFIDSSDIELEEEISFAKSLLGKTILKYDEYNELIASYTKNWEIERVAMMDNIIMKMAICELFEFPSVPVKVTLNEYIEIAKIFSTPKSSLFINGVLDKIVEDLKKTDKIKKIGRGLIDK